ncbi:chloride channel protein [Aggregatilineales bacterium SYSU G02658]
MWDKIWDIRQSLTVPTLFRDVVTWLPIATVVGVMAGLAAALFLVVLDAVTAFREANPLLILLLPLAGLGIGFVYHRFGGRAKGGNALIIEEIHVNGQRLPRRMMPFILIGTWVSHLFGASVGREGTGVQMSASLADQVAHRLRLTPERRRIVLITSIAAGFSAVFNAPVAGLVFALEVYSVGQIRYDALLPALVGTLIGDWVVQLLQVPHGAYPLLPALDFDAELMLKVIAAGLIFGLAARVFIRLTDAIRHVIGVNVSSPPFRPVVGGVIIVALTLLLATDQYNGLSVELAKAATQGESVPPLAFLLKIVFTAVSLGSGFVGGEVTPLFVIGSTLGADLAQLLAVDSSFLASIGFVAVFAAASNTPIACVLLGVELFGGGSLVYLMVACVVAYFASGHRSIYGTQRVVTPKYAATLPDDPPTIHEWGQKKAD